MNRSSLKKLGRRKAGTYGRTHGPTRGNSKRHANKAVRRTVSYDDVSLIAMSTGGQRRHPIIIHEGIVKEWVGIGWIDLREATPDDKQKYPEVK